MTPKALLQPQLETVRSREREWVVLDVLHREALDGVLDELGRYVIAPCSNGPGQETDLHADGDVDVEAGDFLAPADAL